MLVKNPKPSSRKWLKRGALVLFAFEAVCFAVSYGLWYKVNTDRALMSSPSRIVKSIFWLATFTGLGYGLLLTSSQTDEEYRKTVQSHEINKNSKEVTSKNQQFMNVLQSASESSKPFYRISKEDIVKTIEK